MMTSLFSVFDPASGMGLSLNWAAVYLGFLLIPAAYWGLPGRVGALFSKVLGTLSSEFGLLLGPKASSLAFLFVSGFLLIVLSNTLGLVPYVFTGTSHLSMALSLSVPLWVSFMLFGWITHTQHMFAHLVPQGTPPALLVFMVLIETVSNLIRPGTLAVRLAANMVAGHLLLALIGGALSPASGVLTMVSVLGGQSLLVLLEAAVAVIQAYVFVVLTTLYAAEVN